MKYLLITIFFVQVSAIAEANNSTVQICDNMLSTDKTLECLSTIAGKTMNDSAVQICDNMMGSVSGFTFSNSKGPTDKTLECLSTIAGKTMNDSAVHICDNMLSTDKTLECLSTIAGKTMNDSAVHICDNMLSTDKTLECLSTIAGKTMNDSAVHICDNMLSTDKTLECLSTIAGKTMNDSAVQICDNMMGSVSGFTFSNSKGPTDKTLECLTKIGYNSEVATSIGVNTYNNNREAIKGVAIEFCRNEIANRYKDDCLDIVAPSRFIDAGAFDLCKKQPSRRQVECFSAMVNKTYHPSLIEECAEKSSRNQGECLSKYGSSIDSMNTQTQPQSRQIKTEAIEFCRNEIVNRYKEDCLDIVAPSQFIDAGAFDLCKKQPSRRQVECFSAMVNKTYHPSLIEECAEKSSRNQGECLSKYGSSIDSQKDETIVIITQNDGNIVQGLPECKYENFYGIYPEGGGCNLYGCWAAGGGCNVYGCWVAGGGCNVYDCVNEAPTDNICQ